MTDSRSPVETDDPHPDYGPCDGLGPGGVCSECGKAQFETEHEWAAWFRGEPLVSTPAPSECYACGHSVADHDGAGDCLKCHCGAFMAAPSEPTDWRAWKQHLIGCADCTAGDTCEYGHAILGSATPDDAPWLRSVSPPRVEGLPEWATRRLVRIRECNAVEPYAQSDPAALVILLADELARLTRALDEQHEATDQLWNERHTLAYELARLTRERDAMQSALDALATAVAETGFEPGGFLPFVSVQLGDRFVSTPLVDPDAVKRIQSAISRLLDGRT